MLCIMAVRKRRALALTLAIGELLQERGIDILYTRTTDIYESPYQKAMEANIAGLIFYFHSPQFLSN